MKKKINKVLIPCLLSIICGAICGKLVYGIYDKKLENISYGEKIYLVQAGTYKDYDNMVKNTSLNKYVYYEDDDGSFKSVIALTENKDNIEKIKALYKDEIIITEYYSNDKKLNKKIKQYDQIISKTTNNEEIQKNILEILNLYKDKNKTLTKVAS